MYYIKHKEITGITHFKKVDKVMLYLHAWLHYFENRKTKKKHINENFGYNNNIF